MEISQRELASQFAALEDEALVHHAAGLAELTEVAQTVLVQELHHRGLHVPAFTPPAATQSEAPKLWKTVTRFRDLSSAIVARSALEAAGIECFLRDENTVRMDWQISNFIGGMRLDVLEADLQAAEEVLQGLPAEDEPLSDTGAMLSSEKCPHCGSVDIRRETRRRGLSLAALLLISLPLPAGPGGVALRQLRCPLARRLGLYIRTSVCRCALLHLTPWNYLRGCVKRGSLTPSLTTCT